MFYNLKQKKRDSAGVLTSVVVNIARVEEQYYEKVIKNTRFFKKKDNIYLKLILWKNNPCILRDYHYWDLGHPVANKIVCSPKFKSVLEKLNLPPHRFYPAEIDVLGEVHQYFVLHFIQEYLQDMVYGHSQFCRAELLETEPILQAYKTGEITDYDHYNDINTKLIDLMQWIFPKKIVFRPELNYDIWGLQGQIILSENAKQKIEKAGITGLDMPELDNSIKVIMGSEIPLPKVKLYPVNEEEAISVLAEPKVEYKKNTKK